MNIPTSEGDRNPLPGESAMVTVIIAIEMVQAGETMDSLNAGLIKIR